MLLNTPGTLLDRSQTIKQIFKKSKKIEGPMTPGNLGSKTIKSLKSLKIMKIISFFEHGKAARQNSAKGALNDSSRSLILSFCEQNVFLKNCGKVSNVSNFDNFLVHPRWS